MTLRRAVVEARLRRLQNVIRRLRNLQRAPDRFERFGREMTTWLEQN